jgi:hypothetical protein
MKTVDWERVLRAYMRHVEELEGSDFLGRYFIAGEFIGDHGGALDSLTPDETAALFSIRNKKGWQSQP